MSQVTCPHCGREATAENINTERMIARCEACHKLYSFQDQVQSEDPLERPPRPNAPVTMPKGITVENRGNELYIERSWRNKNTTFLTVFCIFWDGFFLVWFSMALSMQNWWMFACGTVHALIGIGLTYATLGTLLNTTKIVVQPSDITVSHGPIPWGKGKQIPQSAIKQFYCAEEVHESNDSDDPSTHLYKVMVQRTDRDEDEELVEWMTEPEQALYLEKEIERFMGIRDVPVRGEYRGPVPRTS